MSLANWYASRCNCLWSNAYWRDTSREYIRPSRLTTKANRVCIGSRSFPLIGVKPQINDAGRSKPADKSTPRFISPTFKAGPRSTERRVSEAYSSVGLLRSLVTRYKELASMASTRYSSIRMASRCSLG